MGVPYDVGLYVLGTDAHFCMGVPKKPAAPVMTNVSVSGNQAAGERTQKCSEHIPNRVQGKHSEDSGLGDTIAKAMTNAVEQWYY